MKRYFIYIIILVSLFSASCEKILFNDKSATRELMLNEFTAIKVCGIFNICFVQDSSYKVIISGSNNINSITATVEDDTLIIKDKKGMSLNPGRNTLTIHVTTLNYLETPEPVNISARGIIRGSDFLFLATGEIAEVNLNLDYDTIYFVTSANTLGNFHFSGKAHYCTFFNRYGSNIFAGGLVCNSAEIVDDSAGDIYVNATEKIKAYIWAKGNIYYYSDPLIEIAEKRGEGRVIRADE